MIVLGIETSCDETAAAVVDQGTLVRSSVVSSQYALHEEYAGVVPEIASRAHVERLLPVVRLALEEAGMGLGMIDAIAVGHRPGLIGCLLVGTAAAKALAWSLGKPLIGVDHVHAHVYSGLLRREPTQPTPKEITSPQVHWPALGLVVSGGHTSLYFADNWLTFHRVGSTIDDAIGEAYDKAATILGLPHPGGPNLDRLASSPDANDRAVDLPISRIAPDSLDFSFSGLKTALLYAAKGVPNSRPGTPASLTIKLTHDRKRDLAASFQRAAIAAIILKVKRALALLRDQQPKHDQNRNPPALITLLVGGGVTANSALRRELALLESTNNVRVIIPSMEFTMDNAAMIAGLAHELLSADHIADMTLAASPMSELGMPARIGSH